MLLVCVVEAQAPFGLSQPSGGRVVPLISALPLPSQSPSHKSKRQQQELIAELRRRQVKDNRHVYEGKDGAIEDIITGKGRVLLAAGELRRPRRRPPAVLPAFIRPRIVQRLCCV